MRGQNSMNAKAKAGSPAFSEASTVSRLPGLRNGSLIQSLAALLWLPQAAALARAVQLMSQGGHFREIVWLAIAILVIGILRPLLNMQGTRMIFRAAWVFVTELRKRACLALAARSPLDINRPSSGLTASILAEQTDAVLPFITRFQPVHYKLTLIPAAILICVAWLSWVAALILMVAAPLIPFFMAVIGYRAKKASEEQMVAMGSMNSFLLDRLRGLGSIRSLDAVDATAQRFRTTAESLKKRTMNVLRIAFLSSAVLELFSALGIAMVAVYIGFHLLGEFTFGTWGQHLSLGQGLFILLLAPAFFEPLQELSAAWHDRASGKAALDALNRIMDRGLPLPGAGTQSASPPEYKAKTGIVLTNVTFRFPGAPVSVFKNYSLSVAAGEKVALLGPSGGGKSSLLALLGGLIPCASGTVSIANIIMNDDTAEYLRSRMAWVGQKPHIFSGTLQSNVALGRDGVTREQIGQALHFAALDTVAESHRGPIGEGGIGLSGGEALRLALARAMVKDGVDIILADEPTAHLDSITAQEVVEGLLTLAKGKTLIIATHDEALASRMDRVIRLERPA